MSRDDQQLLAAHAAGELGAFDELVRRHQGRLWAVAVATCREHQDAADALQEALVKIHRSAQGFRGDAAVSTWMHRIVVNAGRDALRRQAVRPVSALPERYDPPAPGDESSSRVDHLVVHEALDQLAADQRSALILVDLYGMSVAEAAELLEVAEGTVKSRCARGRARLAVLLGALDPRPVGTGQAGATSKAPTAITTTGWAGEAQNQGGAG